MRSCEGPEGDDAIAGDSLARVILQRNHGMGVAVSGAAAMFRNKGEPGQGPTLLAGKRQRALCGKDP